MKHLIILFFAAIAMPICAQDTDLSEIYAQMEAIKLHQDSIDSSTLMAVYDYRCMTQDDDGETVVDGMKLCLQVGTHCTRSFPYRKFEKDIASEDRAYMDGYDFLDEEGQNILGKENFISSLIYSLISKKFFAIKLIIVFSLIFSSFSKSLNPFLFCFTAILSKSLSDKSIPSPTI